MKKLQLLPFMALVIAIGLSAFTQKQGPTVFDEAWFVYDGVGSKTDQDSYDYISGNPGCSSGEELCAVRATIDPQTIDPQDPSASKPLEQSSNPGDVSLQDLESASNDFEEEVEGMVHLRD